MAKKKISKHDQMIEEITPNVAYVKPELLTIGVYQTDEDMRYANRHPSVKKLTSKKYGYKIQMVIK